MRKVNDWQTAHPKQPANDRNWIRGTWYTGIMAAGLATRDDAFLRQAREFGARHRWQVGTESSGGNILTCTQTYLELYLLEKDRAFIEPTIAWLDSGRLNTPTGARVWYLEARRRYADSLYVGAPPLAMLAEATGEPKYLEWMDAFFWDVHGELFDERAGLFYRDKRFRGAVTENGQPVFWSRGNGWVLGSLPRILDHLPANHRSRARYEALFKTMAAAIAARQEPDGLWRTNLVDGAEHHMPETSGSGFFCYGLAWGVRRGLLDRATYLPVVQRAWAGLVHCVNADGLVQWGQLVGDRPVAVARTDSHEYVTGTFLLAGSEVFRLAREGGLGAPELERDASSLLPVAAREPTLATTAHPLADTINTFVARQRNWTDFRPSGLSRVDYLRVIEGQVRAMRVYQDATGRIIDPVERVEKFFATPCYAHAVAILAASKQTADADLVESGLRALDISLRDMAAANAAGGHGDFYTWPAMFAYELLQPLASPSRRAAWKQDLAAIDPRRLYRRYLDEASNWCVVNIGGEFLRARHGVTSLAYVDAALGLHRQNFTPHGMFVEHGEPMAYDHFSRYFLGGMLQLGYRGAHFEAYREWVWRGAWTSLFIQSPAGELPAGYRSAHHIWNEAEQCVTFELYASAYARAGRRAEAGAFKRAARLSLASIRHWIRPDGSGYIVKNRYPIEARHGYESYSAHTCYNLLACSMLAQAWHFADDSVEEHPSPADVGGFVIPLLRPFHKIFANAGGTFIEYDTAGDHVYNPTGLIRVHCKDVPPRLGPSDGCAPRLSGKTVNVAVGPSWQDAAGAWHSLAEATPPSRPKDDFRSPAFTLEVLESQPQRAMFIVAHDLFDREPAQRIQCYQTLVVTPGGVTVTDEVYPAMQRMRITWPVLVFDGQERSNVEIAGHTATVTTGGRGVRFTVEAPANVTLARSGQVLNHRNGQVEPVIAEFSGRRAVYRITPHAPDAGRTVP